VLPRPAETRGIRIGRYIVTGRIGRGGMGMVYRGIDEALEREVALKTLTPEGGLESENRARFEIEAKAAARLQHPNIVIVYELGEDRGVPYIAMEMLPGVDLEAVLRSGEPLALVEKLDVVAQVCRGLAYAHERGIVHRDVKPSNIRLLEDGTAKIMDFGIAKLGGTHLTKTGMMVGTVHYMSPEQVRGKPLDGRSDVFSAGVILYEMLAGERPFRGEGATQVLYKIVNEEPPPLDLAALGEAGPRVLAIVARALAKDRDARYPTALALAEDLAALHDEQQRSAGPLPAGLAPALAEARRLAREGRHGEAVEALRALVAQRPTYVEARRALRSALREQSRRGHPDPVAPAGYPELEATFQATATRHATGAELQPTMVVPVDGDAAVAPAEPAESPPRRLWIWAAFAVVVVASASGVVLLRGSRPAAPAVLRLAVRSQPVGAAVLVDGRDSGVVTNGEIVLPSPAPAQVVLTFRKAGHRDETRTVPLPTADAGGVSVTLEATVPLLRVRTDPAGATVSVDGARVAGVTPLQLALDTAADHRISISLDGYLAQEVRVAKGESPAALDLTLQKLAPPGAVSIASSYPLDVLWRGKPLVRAAVAPRVSVAGGRQVLTLLAPTVFLRSEVTVNVASGGETAVDAPALGKLNVRASPDNCQVFVDGAFVDYPPILDRAAVVGRHTVAFRWPDGRRNEQAVEVQRGSPAFVFGRKE
jgi:serine/threonine-protein kinase